jgi:hypothetical protein
MRTRVQYWIEQGLTPEQARIEAANPTRKRRRHLHLLNTSNQEAKTCLQVNANLQPVTEVSGQVNDAEQTCNLQPAAGQDRFTDKSECVNLLSASIDDTEARAQTCNLPAQPSELEVRRLVEQLKAQGLMTEIPARQEILSDAHVLPIRKLDDTATAVVTFNPSQPILVPVPTQASAWKPVESETAPKTQVSFSVPSARQLIKPAESEVKWLRMLGCSLGSVVCMSTLIVYGTISGGRTPEALFWSTVTTVAGSILLVLPFRWESWKSVRTYQSAFIKLFGVFLVVVSYTTLHTANDTAEQEILTTASSGTTKEQLIQKNIDDLEAQLKPIHQAIAGLDPVADQKAIARLQKRAEPKEALLFTARNDLIAAHAPSAVATKVSAGTAGSWSLVKWLRQLILEPLNLLCLHALVKDMSELRAFIRRKAAERAQRRLEKNTRFKIVKVV